MFEPVVNAHLGTILFLNPVTASNGDLVDQFKELLYLSERESVTKTVSHRRAFRAFEIGYCVTLEGTQVKHRDWKPDPRIDIANLGAYEAILQEIVEQSTVFFVEAKLEGNELKAGTEAIRRTKMERALKGAENLLSTVGVLRRFLVAEAEVDMVPLGNIIGSTLARICLDCNVGLTIQLKIAGEVRHA